MSDMAYGTCPICGMSTRLIRTNFHYGIKCECHSPDHFEPVWHCEYCLPEEPEETTICVKTSELRKLKRVGEQYAD